MTSAAYALIGLFAAISTASGLLAARLLGPWRWWTPLLPILASFGALYLVGHRLGWSAGPEVPMFGFRVALPFDVAVALGIALAAAAAQSGAIRLLQPQQGSPGRDGNA
ncbi:MAG TPA: hypothetical protein VLA59_10090 [Patescibacteria group bacterium]|nr:hypothetical protein [Patescibacteria group bacterium]